MSRDNFDAVMEEIFRHEGGLSMNPKDPGNWTGGKVGFGELRGTKYGIAAASNPGVDVENLTKAQARGIYRRNYWDAIRGDDLRAGLDLVTMDPAVNSGVSRGVRWLQAACGAKQDGRMGPKTLSAANHNADPGGVIRRACAARMGFLRGLRTWGSFGRGWSRRVASVEAAALAMLLEGTGEAARPTLIEQKASAQAAAKREQAGAGGAATGAGGFTFADVPDWALWVGLAILALVIINQIGRARYQKDRAEAMQRVAEGVQR